MHRFMNLLVAFFNSCWSSDKTAFPKSILPNRINKIGTVILIQVNTVEISSSKSCPNKPSQDSSSTFFPVSILVR